MILRWLFVEGFIAKFFNSRLLQILLPSLAGAYFLTLSLWGNEWEIIVCYKQIHERLFLFLMFLTVISQLYKGIGEAFFRTEESYVGFLEGSMLLTASVVNHKLKRFSSKAKKLAPNSDTFKIITKPKEQIDYIIDQSIKWLKDSFSLSDDQISMTIISFSEKDNIAFYLFKSHESWQQTKAKNIINEKSAASYCLEKGESIFFADKFSAAENGKYFLSDRDKRMKSGSIYCYPVFVEVPSHKDKYIISLVTYGKLICNPDDEKSSKIAQSIFREICRRIELELTLYSIRSWRFNE